MITLVDYIGSKFIQFLVEYQKQDTITESEISYAMFSWKISFLTNALTPLFISYCSLNFFGKGGLTDTIYGLFISMISIGFFVRAGLITSNRSLEKIHKVEEFARTGEGEIYT